MKVFISWSGEKSRAVAQALYGWLPQLINVIDPWISEEDIGKGRRWSAEIAGKLAVCKAGIICVTQSNREAPWLLFEAGALSKAVEEAYVCPLLVDLQPQDVTGPLAQFQSTLPMKKDIYRLVSTLNELAGDFKRSEFQLSSAFEKWWPDLDESLKKLPSEQTSKSATRTADDILAEVLENLRGLFREFTEFRSESLQIRRSIRRGAQMWGPAWQPDWQSDRPINAVRIEPKDTTDASRLEVLTRALVPTGTDVRVGGGVTTLHLYLDRKDKGVAIMVPRNESDEEWKKYIAEAVRALEKVPEP